MKTPHDPRNTNYLEKQTVTQPLFNNYLYKYFITQLS